MSNSNNNNTVEFNKNDEKLNLNFKSNKRANIEIIKEVDPVDEPKVSPVSQMSLGIEPRRISYKIKKPNEPKPSFMKMLSEKFSKSNEPLDKSIEIGNSSNKHLTNDDIN
jgi:hypothetical protein